MMTARRIQIIELVSAGQIDAVKELIDKTNKRDLTRMVNETNYVGNCAVLAAVDRNDLEMLKVLIEAGANINVKDPIGRSARSFAQICGYSDIVELIDKTIGGGCQSPRPK